MTPKRPQSLKWIGAELPDGRPERFLEFVPPRDLTEEETDALTQDQLAVIRQHDDLYKEVHAQEPKKSAAKKSNTKPTSNTKPSSNTAPTPPEAPGHTITGVVGETPDTAAEPATESEG